MSLHKFYLNGCNILEAYQKMEGFIILHFTVISMSMFLKQTSEFPLDLSFIAGVAFTAIY